MNSEGLKTIFQINDLTTGSIQAVYTFDNGSGCLIFNDYYPTGVQAYTGDINSPISETCPAISIGCSSSVTNNLDTSSGIFTGDDVLQVSDSLSTGNWTFFIDYNQNVFPQGNIARVIVSSMSESLSGSGFNFGINASNRPYFEYIDSGDIRKIFTHDHDVGINNLISVSQSNNALTIINHDIGSFEHEVQEFTLTNFVESDTLYIGNFPTGVNAGYQGFSGNVDSFVLYQESLTSDTQNTIAENYFYSGIQSGTTISSGVSGLEVTGVNVNLTGLTGSGITGHISAIYKTVESCLCGDINFYRDSGVSGDLFGQVVTYLTGSGYITGLSVEENPPSRVNDYGKTLKYAEKGITFLNELPDDSVYELYTFTTFHDNDLNNKAEYQGGFNYFNTNTGYQSGNLNVFGNGLAQYSGTEFAVIDGSLNSKKIKFSKNNFSGVDTVVFDIISGNQEAVSTFSGFAVTGLNLTLSGSGYTSIPSVVFNGGENTAATAITGAADGTTKVTGLILVSGGSGHVAAPVVTIEGGGSPTQTATAEAFIDQTNYILSTTNSNDPYLNGYKLISGLDYTQSASSITLLAPEIQKSQYATGDVIFLPKIETNYVRVTGVANQFVNTQTALIEEQLWLNRKRVRLDEDYQRVSLISLLKQPVFISGYNNIIYNNENNFFNT